MATPVKWSTLAAFSANVASTNLDSKASNSTLTPIFVADIDNASQKSIYFKVWMVLGSINSSAGGSITLQLREKNGSTYSDNPVETLTIPVNSGSSIKNLAAFLRLPSASVFGLYWANQTGTTSAASGNSVTYQFYDEEI